MKPVGSKTLQALVNNERVTKYVMPPKNVGSIEAWERQVRRVLDITEEYTVLRSRASNVSGMSLINFEFVNAKEQRIKVVVDRKG